LQEWLPRYPQAVEKIALRFFSDRFHALRIFFCPTAPTPLTSGIFCLVLAIFFEITIPFRRRNEFFTLSPGPAIKDDINFFLDFDFQPLYTFINCGFLLRTAHP
jgi:hypothetical protein